MKAFFLCTVMIIGFIISENSLMAQTGTLTGKITESGGARPLAGATVKLLKPNETTSFKGGFSTASGSFTVRNIEPGSYRVVISSVGFKTVERNPVVITAGETAMLNVSLEGEALNMNDIVVTASRRQEKALEAPASISVVDPIAIAERPVMIPTEHLRGVTGVDFAQTGISQQTTVTRGFNNVFSGMLLTLSDYRIAGVPSLRVNVPYFNPIINDDIDRMELVRGPGSALYGPNATQGVLNIITKSPFASQGTSVSVAGGERNLFNGTLRHAGTVGENFGFKISGQYMRADDWQYIDREETIAFDTAVARGALLDTLKIAKRDPVHERFSVDARADYLFTEDLKANFSTGISQTLRSVEMTGVGAAQAKDWSYYYVQGRVDYGNLFVQTFLNQSNAGNSYLLRDGAEIVDKSRLIVGRIQHSYELGEMQSFTYGGDAFFTMPETEGTINGRFENDDDINEYGAYLQSETHLFDNMLDVILTGRMDIHSRLEDPVFSPRAALVFKPNENNNIRFTLNRAFNTPSTNELFLDIVAKRNAFPFPEGLNADIRASGVPVGGYIFDRNGGFKMHSHFSRESGAIPVAGAAALWGAATEIVIGGAPAAFKTLFEQLRNVPAPTPADISGIMAILNPTSGEFSPVSDVQNIEQLRPTTNQTFEIGYKGIVADALQIGVDVYYSQVKDVIGSLQVFTPNVFFNSQELDLYLRPRIKPQLVEYFKTQPGFTQEMAEAAAESAASQVIGGYAQIPLGTVTPQNASNPTDIMLAYRNAGNIDMMGTDISVEYALGRMIGVTASYSVLRLLERDDYNDSAKITGTYISKIDGSSDFALNAPEHKASFGLKFHEREMGLRAGIQYRYNDGFKMNSGVYIGDVEHSNLVDITLGYDLPWVSGLKLDISATNIFDNRTQYFVGAPEIGRLVMARLGYTF